MKWSYYNQVITLDNEPKVFYIFNCFSLKAIGVDIKLKSLICDNINDPVNVSYVHPDFYETLVREQFVVDDDINEQDKCIKNICRKLKADETVKITINPTLDCNLRCWYCYENHIKGSYMNTDTIKKVLYFIEKTITSPSLKNLQLSFFGGEPFLMYNKVMKPFIIKCGELCKLHNKGFYVNATTNGVFLTKKVVDEVISFSPSFGVQVAFDGGKEYYNRVKYTSDGKGVYDIVKKNLYYALECGVRTTIRCNYTLENIDSFLDVLNDFKIYWKYPNLRFSFHKVWQEPLSQELKTKIKKFKSAVSNSNFHSNINSFNGYNSTCYADYTHNFVINYNGDLFKCTARDFKRENRIGYIGYNGDLILHDRTKNKPTFTSECYCCRLLPICTICSQQKLESKGNKCPGIDANQENISSNIKKYFLDLIHFN